MLSVMFSVIGAVAGVAQQEAYYKETGSFIPSAPRKEEPKKSCNPLVSFVFGWLIGGG